MEILVNEARAAWESLGRIRYEVFGALKKGQLERLVSSLLPR